MELKTEITLNESHFKDEKKHEQLVYSVMQPQIKKLIKQSISCI